MSDTEDKPSLMSASLRSFLWQRIVELLGFAVCLISLCLLLVLITANENDPSFNTAVLNEGSFSLAVIRTSNRQSEIRQTAKPSNSTIRCQRKDRRLADIRDGLSSVSLIGFSQNQPAVPPVG